MAFNLLNTITVLETASEQLTPPAEVLAAESAETVLNWLRKNNRIVQGAIGSAIEDLDGLSKQLAQARRDAATVPQVPTVATARTPYIALSLNELAQLIFVERSKENHSANPEAAYELAKQFLAYAARQG